MRRIDPAAAVEGTRLVAQHGLIDHKPRNSTGVVSGVTDAEGQEGRRVDKEDVHPGDRLLVGLMRVAWHGIRAARPPGPGGPRVGALTVYLKSY